jgi:hypothetical protein
LQFIKENIKIFNVVIDGVDIEPDKKIILRELINSFLNIIRFKKMVFYFISYIYIKLMENTNDHKINGFASFKRS